MRTERPRSTSPAGRLSSSKLARWSVLPFGLAVTLVLAGCTQQELQGYLPGGPDVTNHTEGIISLWVNSWIVLLAIGVITWGLAIWAAIAYRRRKGQTGFPAQLRYHMPIEIFFTIVPFILVVGFFAFTAKEQTAIESDPGDPDVIIHVYGKQWAWDTAYVTDDAYEWGVQAQDAVKDPIDPTLSTIWLPVNEKVQLDIDSRDVAHSLWIIDFLYKKDVLPSHPNHMYFTPLKEGTYAGKCAELCGQYHADMLFQVKVVSRDEYDAHIAQLKAAGQTGSILDAYNRQQNLPGNGSDSED